MKSKPRARDPRNERWSAIHGYAAHLGLRKFDMLSLQKRVLEGFVYATLISFQSAIGLPLGEVAELVQINPRTMSRRKDSGRFNPDESDRILRAARLYGLTLELFEGDRDAARRWLKAPSVALDGETPLKFARTEIGCREVEQLIGRLEHGVAS